MRCRCRSEIYRGIGASEKANSARLAPGLHRLIFVGHFGPTLRRCGRPGRAIKVHTSACALPIWARSLDLTRREGEPTFTQMGWPIGISANPRIRISAMAISSSPMASPHAEISRRNWMGKAGIYRIRLVFDLASITATFVAIAIQSASGSTSGLLLLFAG